MSDKTLTFTVEQLAAALNNVRCLYDLGPDLIAEEVFAAVAQQPAPAVPDGWRDVLDRARESIGAGSLQENANTERQYVEPYLDGIYDELEALENGAAPAAPVAVGREPVARAFGKVCGGDAEHNTVNVRVSGPVPPELWTIGTAVALYTAPPAAEQPECVTCSGHGLVGNRLDDGEECPECHGAGIICGTECGACAEQPDTVAVPRELLEQIADSIEAQDSLWHRTRRSECLPIELIRTRAAIVTVRALLGKEGE